MASYKDKAGTLSAKRIRYTFSLWALQILVLPKLQLPYSREAHLQQLFIQQLQNYG